MYKRIKNYCFCSFLLTAPSLMALSSSSQIETPPAGVFTSSSLKADNYLWLDVEALFWQSNMNGLEYATRSDSITGISHGSVKQPDFNWTWGVRAGLGFRIPRDHWDVLVNYTYVHATASGHASSPSGGALYPQWATSFGFPGSSFYVDKASALWKANVNIGDLELGRTCRAGKWLTVRPLMGIRGLVIQQNYHVNYEGGSAFPGDKDRVRMSNDFWGVGLRLGANTLWGLGKGFGIYGNGSVSLLSGHFDVHEKEKLKSEGTPHLKASADRDNVVVTADLALGLQWDYMFSRDRYHFGVKLGWEFNVFFDQNQLFNFMSNSNPGAMKFLNDDLSFQGVTLGFRFDF